MTNARVTGAGYWMPTKPLATMQAVTLTVLVVVLAAFAVLQFQLTYLQRFYVTSYLKSGIRARLHRPDTTYTQVRLTWKGHAVFASSDDVRQVQDAAGHPVLVLSSDAKRAGAEQPYVVTPTVPNAEMYHLIATYIYQDRGVLVFVRTPLIIGGVTLVALLAWSIPLDIRRARERRQGAHLRGAEIVSTAEFNRRVRSA
ncbi:MAG: hypothetical protein ABJA98_21345 [Acidobacteriota bacterium]